MPVPVPGGPRSPGLTLARELHEHPTLTLRLVSTPLGCKSQPRIQSWAAGKSRLCGSSPDCTAGQKAGELNQFVLRSGSCYFQRR